METQTPRPTQMRRGHFFTKQRIPDAVSTESLESS